MLHHATYMFAPFIIPAITAGIGLIQSLSAGQKQKEEEARLKQAIANKPTFKPSEYIKNMVADARARQNAESPAVRQAYEQVRQQAADTAAQAQRNATSGAQALGAGAIAQQQMQSVTPQLAAQQEAYHQANLNRADQAAQAMANQQAMQYQSEADKHNDLVNMYLGKVGAYNQNKAMGLSAAIQGGLAAAGGLGKQAPQQVNNSYTGKPMNFTLQIPQRQALPSLPIPPQPIQQFGTYNPFFGSATFNPFFNRPQ